MSKHDRARYMQGCRCPKCSAANARYMRRYRRRPIPDDLEHGTANAYLNRGCRCDPCTHAHYEYNLEGSARIYLARRGIDLDELLTRNPSMTRSPEST